MRRSRLLSTTSFALAISGVVACSGILGFDHLYTEGGYLIDSGTDAGAGEGGTIQPEEAGVDLCGVIGIPDSPLDASAVVMPPVLVALKLLDFGLATVDGGRPDVPGLNLDRVCSTTIDTSSCTKNVTEPTFESYAKDKTAAGLDNAGFHLIEYISGFSTILTADAINDGIRTGRYGAVLRLMGWNGEAEDDDLQIEVFPAIGLARAASDGGFDPNDRWVLDERFQVAQGIASSLVHSDRAWVSGGKVVARFKAVTLPIFLSGDQKPFDMHLTDAILEGTLSLTNGVGALSLGVVSGRWKTSDFLGQVRTIFVKDGNGLKNAALCEPITTAQFLYNGVKSQICDARDIRGDSQDTARLACDALSVGMRIEAYGVKNLGDFDAGVEIKPRCTDAAVPVGDDCPP